PFRALSRDPARAHELLGEVPVVEGDFERPETLAPAMEDVDHVFLLTPGATDQVAQEGAVVEAARRAGAVHIVKQSVHGAALESPSALVRWHAEAERLVESSGLGYTILRPALFMQMATLLRGPDGTVRSIVGDARIGFVDTRDIAAVAVEALTKAGHQGRIYDLTGPETLTWDDVAERLTRAGLPTRYQQVSEDESRAAMAQYMPAWRVEPTLEFNREIGRGLYDATTNDVELVTGRPPRSFDDFVVELQAAA
ncbi:MAG TPA: NAD(P)H-binding protein, partial [Thermoleophilia bacterium]|nr:NAD(P)H-binding protein [Thermoleophilia bacterium]